MIKVTNASFAYGNEVIFQDINLEINRGEIFCLFGPNGCGKSTLIHCMLGILTLSSGSITLAGKDVSKLTPRAIAREVAYIPQVHEKPFPFKVIDMVLMGRTAYTGMFSSPTSRDKEIAEQMLEKVGMIRFKDRPYTQLSGGETQLVMVARALAQQTPVLIMDEPTAHLDFRNELKFLETVVKLVQDTDLTIVMATHFPNHAFYFEGSNLKAHLALMNDKKITAHGSPFHVLTEENMERTFQIKSRVVSYESHGRQLRQIVPLETFQ